MPLSHPSHTQLLLLLIILYKYKAKMCFVLSVIVNVISSVTLFFFSHFETKVRRIWLAAPNRWFWFIPSKCKPCSDCLAFSADTLKHISTMVPQAKNTTPVCFLDQNNFMHFTAWSILCIVEGCCCLKNSIFSGNRGDIWSEMFSLITTKFLC